ncbi:MAG: hypothetical protein MUP47_02095 [Phycisphaerae bacterium]|nr:hypothetical protein [Phycisphaerae bacterium]
MLVLEVLAVQADGYLKVDVGQRAVALEQGLEDRLAIVPVRRWRLGGLDGRTRGCGQGDRRKLGLSTHGSPEAQVLVVRQGTIFQTQREQKGSHPAQFS